MLEASSETADEWPLAEGPVEAESPYVNPPVDAGYDPPPLEPVPFVDPCAGLAQKSPERIQALCQQLRQIPWQIVQNGHKRLFALPTGHKLSLAVRQLLQAFMNPKSDPALLLKQSSAADLDALGTVLQELGRQKLPANHPPQLAQEQQSLQLLARILEAEGLRRHG